MALLIFYVLLALGVSFLCSVMEAVLLSVTPSYVAALEQDGSAAGERLRVLKDDIDRPLAAILSLNTVAHTVGAAGAGAQAAVVWGDTSVAIFSGVLTLFILILSEIIPKTVGALYWRRLAPPVARLLLPLIWVVWPLVKLSQGITKLLQRGRPAHASVSREEFTALAELGAREGVFEAEESRILTSLFRFRSLRVRDIMTPRIVVFTLPEHKTVYEVVEEHDTFRFSRIPVYGDNRDDITGYVLKDDVLLKAAQEENLTLAKLRREMLVVPDALPLPDLFARLLDHLEHIALVVDEYGGVAGVVSMEDAVETLLGMEIVDEADSARDMQELARQQWVRRARRLGLVPEDFPTRADEETAVQYGLTGGQPPHS